MDHLGDDVLILILSGLSLKEAGRTSVLSSRFKNLWKYSSKIHTLVDETITVSHDFQMLPSSYIRRRSIVGAAVSIQTLSVGVCELLPGRTIQNSLAQYPWLDVLILWRVRGLGAIFFLRSDTVSRLCLEELPRVQGIVLQMPRLVSLSYAGRRAQIGFQPNPPVGLWTASFDFRRNFEEEGGVVANIPGTLAFLLQQLRHTTRRLTISTFFSGEMELELIDTVTVITLGVTHLVLEMTYSHPEDFQGVLSILGRCTALHSLTIRLLDRAPFQVQVQFSADYFTVVDERKYTYEVQHISLEGVAQHMFDRISSFLGRIKSLKTLTLSSYSEVDRDFIYGWVDAWIGEGMFPTVVMMVR